MVAKDHSKTKAEVGEIDTSAPFQSVKDAVSLFGEGAFSGERPAIKKVKPHSAERVLAKETQLHLAEKELNKLKGQLENAEATKTEALIELDRSKLAVVDLTQKLKVIHELRDSAIASTLASKQFTEMNESSVSNTGQETAKAEYISATAELNAAKQDLRIIRQEYNLSLEIINVANQQAKEAEIAADVNTERVGNLSKEITSTRDSIEQAKIESERVKEEEEMILADKNERRHSCKSKHVELEKRLASLKRDVDSEVKKNLEDCLRETLSETVVLRNEIEDAKGRDLDSIQALALELGGAKGSLHKACEEENSLRSLVESLKVELDELKKEHLGLKEKEVETESNAGNLHVKLRKAKSDLEDAIAEEARARGASDEMIVSLRQMANESLEYRRESEEMRVEAEELKREAEAARVELQEAEEKLKSAVEEAEEAKEAEARALSRIKKLSEETDAARASSSSEIGGSRIVISKDEFEALGRKAEERERLAEMKVEAAVAQVEAVRASENEAVKRLEGFRKETEEMKAGAREAARRAEMAEAARKAVEGELRRWREREEKKAAEVASRILDETEKKEKEQTVEIRKMEKSKTVSVGKSKKLLLPSLSSVFYKKKSS